MKPDPSYLSHFGELATLKNTLASYFNQDWSAYSATEEEVLRQIVRENSTEDLERLVEQTSRPSHSFRVAMMQILQTGLRQGTLMV